MEFERLGAFYPGKQYNVAAKEGLDRPLMYDARDLTTHAVCVSMIGSGKTGLYIDILEEAAIDSVPAIITDPKGDVSNLLLIFPELRPEDFRPWINVDDARRKGLSEEAFAAQQAELWRSGLAEWGQDGERIRLLRESADFVIYTPGSDAGVPVSILQSFAAPPLSWDAEAELIRERIQGAVSALLGLVGVDADPVQSREHILLSNLFEHFWRQGEDLDLPKLILSIQRPPMRQLGVFDADTFFPEKDRSTKAKLKLEEGEETIKEVQQDIEELEEELQEEVAAIRDHQEEALEEFEEVQVRPRRTDVQVDLFALAWAPHWPIAYQDRGGTIGTDVVPAH